MKIDFSFKDGFSKETPKPIIIIYTIIMLISGLWVYVLQPNFTDLNDHLQLIIIKILGSLNAGIIFICHFFKWKDNDPS